LLPSGWVVYVQFDSWYASEQLIKYVRRQGWYFTYGIKHNRKFYGKRIDQIASALRHRRYTYIPVTAADGTQTDYYIRHTTVRLQKVPFDIHVFFSKRHTREKSLAYFISTDLARSDQQALQGFCGRWSCEVGNFSLKTHLGLRDFWVRAYEVVDKYLVVGLLTWVYIERRYELEHSAPVKTYGDLIRRHRNEHVVEWLTSAIWMMPETGYLQWVFQRYLRLDSIVT
jgi:hypothetical protein